MPSEIMDQRQLSSVCMASAPTSFFSNGICFLNERQADCLKPDSLPCYQGTGEMLSLPQTKLAGDVGSNSAESLKYFNLFSDHRRKFGVDQGGIDSERTINQSKIPLKDSVLQSALQTFQSKNNMISSSLVEAFSRRLILSPTDHLHDHSTNIIDPSLEHDENLESLEEVEARAIGDLLPDDDDLISGVTDGIECLPRHDINDADDDIFCSIGGMELEADDKISYPSNFQHPSRMLFVGNVDGSIEDSELRLLFEQFGSVRSLYTSCKQRGFVRVSYYDLRSSRSGMKALQSNMLRNRILDVQFSFPKDNLFEGDINEGMIEILSTDFSVTDDDLIQIFATYGDVKEIREIPHNPHHKLVEFYDIRAAQAAFHGLNGSNKIRVLYNKPGVTRWSPIQQSSPDLEWREYWPQGSPIDHGSTNHRSISSYLCSPNQHQDNTRFSQGLSSPARHNGLLNGLGSPYARSLPEYHECLTSRPPVNSPSPILCPDGVNSHAFDYNGLGAPVNRNWSNGIPYAQQWSNSPSMLNFPASPSQAHGPIMSGPFLQMGHHFTAGSAPSGNNLGPTLWDRRGGGPQFTSLVNPLELSSQGFGPAARYSPQPRRNPLIPPLSPFDSLTDRVRLRKSDLNSNQIENKKQFELDIERIIRGEDARTTLMIKNIPNKYTSKMLLAAIDENHQGTYDFIYLPIDFKNKCNVGYAFINMVDPAKIIPFFQTFNGKKWEKFNSEKVATLAYARIQGKSALIAHFQNSSLMNEDKRCRPILFQTQGPNAGDQEPFPMGVHMRSRHGRSRSNNSHTTEQTQSGMTTASPSLQGDDSPNASDSSSPGSLSTLD